MKNVNKIKDKKLKGLKKPIIKPKKEKVLIVAQEIKFARLLSGNEKKTRDRVLKSFKKWLLNCFEKGHEFKEDDFTRVWKGLFYAVWMSDKPLVQEDLCETIAGILDLFPEDQIQNAFLMFKAGFKVLATEWYGIDHHRLDKFLMLVRRYLRGSLRCVARCKWKVDVCKKYAETLGGKDGILALKTPLYARNAGSMLLHVVDCFLEELAKVSEGNIPGSSVVELLRPICSYMVGGEAPSLCVSSRRVLTQLLRQSDLGLEYRERTRAWEQMGCPRGGPDALEPASDDEEDTDIQQDGDNEDIDEAEKPLDPRAGRVDVVLHTIPVPASGLAQVLKELLTTASSKAHKRTKICLERFEQLAKDQYPLRVQDVLSDEADPRPTPTRAANALRALEKRLASASDELTLRGLRRKHRKRLLAKSRAGLSIVDDVRHNITSTNGDWAVEATESKEDEKTNKQTDKSSNKENVQQDKQTKKRKHADARQDAHNKRNKNNRNDNQVKLKDKKPSVDKVKKTLENGVANSKKVDKLKSDKQTDKQTQVAKQKLANGVEKVKQDVKNAKTGNIHLTQDSKVAKIAQKEVEKPKKLEKPTKNASPKSKNKILNGKIEKRLQEKLKKALDTPKKVKFVLKNNSMQGTIDYYKSVRQSPSIPFDGTKKPTKTNLKVSTPSPINPFFKKKLRLK